MDRSLTITIERSTKSHQTILLSLLPSSSVFSDPVSHSLFRRWAAADALRQHPVYLRSYIGPRLLANKRGPLGEVQPDFRAYDQIRGRFLLTQLRRMKTGRDRITKQGSVQNGERSRSGPSLNLRRPERLVSKGS